MLKRYFSAADGASSPPPPTGARFDIVTIISSSPSTITEKTFIIGGPASGTITFKVTTLTKVGDLSSYFNVNGSNMNLGDTFTLPTDGAGNCNYTSITYGGSHSPSVINAVVTIFTVSGGTIGSPSTRSYSRVV